MRRGRAGLIATLALVAAAVAFAHAPVLDARAQSFDDPLYVFADPLVQHPSLASVDHIFSEVLRPSAAGGYYLPLSLTSLMADVALGGSADDPRPFHRTGLALHVVATLLLTLIVLALFEAPVPAALAGLLFGLHPLTVEPVAWIAERKTLLAACFALAAILAYVRHARAGGRVRYAAALGCFALALLAKPTVTPLPLLLLALDRWPLGRDLRRSLADLAPFAVLAAVSGVITVISQQHTASVVAADPARLPAHALYTLGVYVAKIVVPRDPSSVYPAPASLALSAPQVAAPIALALLITAACVALVIPRRARRVAPLVAWLGFVAMLAPTLGLARYSWVEASDKYLYLPAVALVVAFGAALTRAWTVAPPRRVPARIAMIAAAAALLALEARGVRAALVPWRDSLTLFRYMERVAPDSPAVENQLGVLLERSGAADEGLVRLRRAVALAPGFDEAHYNLGIAFGARGVLDSSLAEFHAADRLHPDDPPTVYNLGVALRMSGRPAEAERELRRALALDPRSAATHDALGSLEIAGGRSDEAIGHFRAAVTLAPGDPALQYRLGVALLIARRGAEAIDPLRRAIVLRPDGIEALHTLAWVRATAADAALRDTAEAITLARRAVALTNGDDPRVLDTMAAAEASVGRFAAALASEHQALDRAAALPDSVAAGMRERLRLYRSGHPYREP
ncbi:MAG: tetratricopeptide repeat protein [Candidatus Eisenbacteria bacterium]|uniref:Tetratricopeptide repeat protein n=1 Tax=Eiseniibacteriota bacterium TaxID=2212470 RepID=A0A9D6L996_UNCEI|nr:tetratricopeptide repeat protein [Candidatus Eisenbacteria bacterium]